MCCEWEQVFVGERVTFKGCHYLVGSRLGHLQCAEYQVQRTPHFLSAVINKRDSQT